MNKLIIIFFIFSSNLIFSQDYELPKLNYYNPSTFYWNDTITENQKKYWPNGNLKVDYEELGNGTKLKREYFPEGRIKLSVQVTQEYSVDSFGSYDEYGELIETGINKGFIDINNGKYIEYNTPSYSNNDIHRTHGQYKNNKQVGLWKTEEGAMGHVVEGNFDSNGELVGLYKEYYQDYPNKEYSIKYTGNYGLKTISKFIRSYDSNQDKYIKKPITESRRVGLWIWYDRDGTVLEKINYGVD